MKFVFQGVKTSIYYIFYQPVSIYVYKGPFRGDQEILSFCTGKMYGSDVEHERQQYLP